MLSNIHFFPIFPVIIVSIPSMNSPEKSILHVECLELSQNMNFCEGALGDVTMATDTTSTQPGVWSAH